MVPRLFVPTVACPGCSYPNDRNFRFCQRCGYNRQGRNFEPPRSLKASIEWEVISQRKAVLHKRATSTPYAKQKCALEAELTGFLEQSQPPKDLLSATPDDLINFLIWKDKFGKTVVHKDGCPNFGYKKRSSCLCPRRLAFTTVDTMIGKLRSIFTRVGRNLEEASLPGYGKPAADVKVKGYLTLVREEQLEARTLPTQAEPFFIQDLETISDEILRRLKRVGNTYTQLYLLARDQAFFKIQFFAGDRAGDLARTKSVELLFSPDRQVLLFNHS